MNVQWKPLNVITLRQRKSGNVNSIITIWMWMWSGAHGSTHNSGARGPGFDPTPKPRTAFLEALIPLLSDNRLENDFMHL
jgi:hypothetical protein